jgi:hypothetical protein
MREMPLFAGVGPRHQPTAEQAERDEQLRIGAEAIGG